MELGGFVRGLARVLPREIVGQPGSSEFREYVLSGVESVEYSDVVVLALPAPRTEWYEKSSYDDI
jgi:hypothetical protein